MTAENACLAVPAALDGARVDVAASQLFDLSRAAVRRLCEAGRVRVGARKLKKGDPVQTGDALTIEGGDAWLVPDAPMPITVLYETPNLLVIDKPAGIACHPLVPGEGGTLVDAVVAHYPEIAEASEDPREAGLVHRLDTDTSGATCIARDRETWRALRTAFTEGGVTKVYLALVHGLIRDAMVIDDPIDHDPTDPRRMITGAGRAATTRVFTLAASMTASLVRVEAEGGRRHQVRVHLAGRGHPLVGDRLYRALGDAPGLPGHALHAWQLVLPGQPRVKAPVPLAFMSVARTFNCDLPVEMRRSS